MSSKYAEASLPVRNGRGLGSRLRGKKGAHSGLDAGAAEADILTATLNPPLQATPEMQADLLGSGRFHTGVLRPIIEPEQRQGPAGVLRALRAGQLGVLDWLLLVAETASALVVGWLVLQYIYTVYFDTAPHRLTPVHASTYPAGVATPRSSATPVSTPTALSRIDTSTDGQEVWDYSRRARTRWHAADLPVSKPTITPTPMPTVDPALLLPVRLRIPVMFLDSPVREVTINMGTWEVSPMDIGHHEGSANPGDVGNVVLAGHRDINSALFRELDRLKPGDPVYVSTRLHEYKYIVTDSFVVSPDHTEVMDPTDDRRVTLITCTPIGLATQRLIVTGMLADP